MEDKIFKENWIDRFVNWLRGIEFSLSNLIALLVALGAPFPAALLTYVNTQSKLGFGQGTALITATVVEGMGIASLATMVEFWSSERDRKKREERQGQNVEQGSQFWLLIGSIIAFLFYLIIVIAVNVFLHVEYNEFGQIENLTEVVVLSLITSLSVPGGILFAIRSQFTASRVRLRTARKDIIEAEYERAYYQQKLELDKAEARAKIQMDKKALAHQQDMERLSVQSAVQSPVQPVNSVQKDRSLNSSLNKNGTTQVALAEEWLERNNNNGWFTEKNVPSAREIMSKLEEENPGRRFSSSSMQRARNKFIKKYFRRR